MYKIDSLIKELKYFKAFATGEIQEFISEEEIQELLERVKKE